MDELWPKNERNIDDEGVEHIWIQLTHMWIIISHGWNYKWMKIIKSFIFVYMCEAYIPTSIPIMNQLPLSCKLAFRRSCLQPFLASFLQMLFHKCKNGEK